jgi:membrane protein YdbS with pleckstrin-like domain/DNA-directed RNA polymerase subunit RPC12/RpoP
MPDYKFNCPHCGQSLEAPEDMGGQSIDCPSCSKPLVIPAPAAPPATPPITTKACLFCGEEILIQARKCKHCGEILDESLRMQATAAKPPPAQNNPSFVPEKTVYESHPSMFKNHPVGFIISIGLCLFGIGFIILLIWWLNVLGTTLTVTNKRTVLRKGILSKSTNEVRHQDVRNIQVSQGILQRIFNVGAIGISSAGHGGIEIEVFGMPSPDKVKKLIDQYRS